jgi:uncharacterized protein (TIGR02284 family)
MTRDDNEVALLNLLIRATLDSVEGYREAADNAGDPELKAHFAERSLERLDVVSLLREQVQFLGGQPQDDGTALGGAHRVFTILKSLVAGQNDAAIFEEIRRGEKYLIGQFNAALDNSDASLDTLDVIEDAHRRIAAGYERMLTLLSRAG